MTGARWLFNDGDARSWSLVSDSGTVLASLEPDRDSGQYRGADGRLMGRRWEEAKKKTEDLVQKASK